MTSIDIVSILQAILPSSKIVIIACTEDKDEEEKVEEELARILPTMSNEEASY